MVQKCLIRFLACTQLRDFVYNRKCFWINTGASVDYRKLSSDVLQTIKNRGVNIIRINDTDVYEDDDVCDKDTDALTMHSDCDETSSLLMGYLHGASIGIRNISIVAQKFPKLRHLELDSLSYILGDGTAVDPFPISHFRRYG